METLALCFICNTAPLKQITKKNVILGSVFSTTANDYKITPLKVQVIKHQKRLKMQEGNIN